jgi:hypothetical protein
MKEVTLEDLQEIEDRLGRRKGGRHTADKDR